jgi:putative serine protease PepD
VIDLPPPAPVELPPPPPPGEHERHRRVRHGLPARLLVAVGLVAAVSGMLGALLGLALSDRSGRPPRKASEQPIVVAPIRDEETGRIDIAGIVDVAGRSVVTISADTPTGVSIGTGVVLTEDGEVLTNAHVVDDATAIRVRLPGETEPREAALLAADAGNDLALLRLDVEGLVPATFADPASTRLGDEVVAIGYALDLDGDPTVTSGIVSALDRTIVADRTNGALDGLIQTDAAISSGNSGGPLVNTAGQVVGINTAVAVGDDTFAAVNIGFAISVAEALPVIEALRDEAGGEVRQEGYLGVGLGNRRDGGQGAVITEVAQDTPAEDAGLLAGDIVVAVDEVAIEGEAGLVAAIRDLEPGDSITVRYRRNGTERVVSVTLAERPDG